MQQKSHSLGGERTFVEASKARSLGGANRVRGLNGVKIASRATAGSKVWSGLSELPDWSGLSDLLDWSGLSDLPDWSGLWSYIWWLPDWSGLWSGPWWLPEWSGLWSRLCGLPDWSGLWSGPWWLPEWSGLWSGLCGLPDWSGLWSGPWWLPEWSGLWSGLCGLPDWSGLWSGLWGLPDWSKLWSGLWGLPDWSKLWSGVWGLPDWSKLWSGLWVLLEWWRLLDWSGFWSRLGRQGKELGWSWQSKEPGKWWLVWAWLEEWGMGGTVPADGLKCGWFTLPFFRSCKYLEKFQKSKNVTRSISHCRSGSFKQRLKMSWRSILWTPILSALVQKIWAKARTSIRFWRSFFSPWSPACPSGNIVLSLILLDHVMASVFCHRMTPGKQQNDPSAAFYDPNNN